jgi:beta-N-acetylhexosaminidase
MSASRTSPLGRLLILGVRDHRWSRSLERTLGAIQPSGVLLHSEAIRTPGQTAELLHRIAKSLSAPPFLIVAEEGGRVNPLKALLPPLPAPRILARRGPAAVRRSGELMGAAVKLLGFNLNLAPRLDLSNPEVKPALDPQTFGTDARLVANCGRAFIEGLRRHKILACGKHLPGRGVPQYHESGLPIVGKTMAELWREDLLPFRDLLPILPFVMLSNVSYKAYDFDVPQPAALSAKVAHDLLRVKLGYRGVAVADLLELLEETSRHTASEEGAFTSDREFSRSIQAGCDLQVVKWGERIAGSITQKMEKALVGGSLTQERVEAALQRVRAAKKGLKRPGGKLSARSFDRLAREFEEFNRQVTAGGEIEA